MPSNPADGPDPLTPVAEDYLRHIYKLERETDGRATNSAVADRLGVGRSTVTSMFESLADRGLVEYEHYRPVRLTDAGRTAALRVVRRHRLVETLLLELFDYGLGDVHAEADRLEHHLSNRLCGAIEDVLGMPETDPHGDPIPDANLDIQHDDEAVTLADVAERTTVEVTRLRTNDDTLDYLIDVGIEPSTRLTVDERAPFRMVTVGMDDGSAASLPQAVATTVVVRPVEE